MSAKDKPKDQRLQLVAGFVSPEIKLFMKRIADSEGRSVSQVLKKLLEESPRVKAEVRRNGKRAA